LITDEISKRLQQVKVADIRTLPDVLYYEKEMMNKFQEGIINDNINDVYDFISAIERVKGELHSNFLLKHLTILLYQLNCPCFLPTISKLNNPLLFVFYLQSFKIGQLLCISEEKSLTNKWLNFELIRQIIKKEQKDNFEENECTTVKNILERIYISDFNFLKQTIQYFQGSKLFNVSLGELLVTFSDSQIKEILSDCFVINKYDSNYELRKSLLERLRKKSSKQQMKFILTSIYEKWHSFFNVSLDSDDFYLNNLLQTDFCDFVASYYIKVATEEYIITQMLATIKQLKWIESEWFISKRSVASELIARVCKRTYHT
jgi:hypothetical protein